MISKSPSASRFPAIVQWILPLLPWRLVAASRGTFRTARCSFLCLSSAQRDTNIFEDDDWAALYVQGFNCLSLVSPVGNGQSVVVRFEPASTETI